MPEVKIRANYGMIMGLDSSTKNKLVKLQSNLPTIDGGELTPLNSNHLHITLTNGKNFKPFKGKFDKEFTTIVPTPILGVPQLVERTNGKITYVVPIINQSELKSFLDILYESNGFLNPEPNRFFHITIANNEMGDPFKSIGDVVKVDFMNENENKTSDIQFWFDMDGVLADFNAAIEHNTEIQRLKKDFNDLVKTKFKSYIGLTDDQIRDRFKSELKKNPNSDVKELKKAFYRHRSKVFSTASHKGFFLNLNVINGSKEMIKAAYELTGKKPHILSSPIDSNPHCEPEKRQWIKNHFGGMVGNVYIDGNKGAYPKSKKDVLIDDRTKYVDAFQKGGGDTILHKNYKDTIKKMKEKVM